MRPRSRRQAPPSSSAAAAARCATLPLLFLLLLAAAAGPAAAAGARSLSLAAAPAPSPPAAPAAGKPAPPPAAAAKTQPPLGPGWVQLRDELQRSANQSSGQQQQNGTAAKKPGVQQFVTLAPQERLIKPQQQQLPGSEGSSGGAGFNSSSGFKCGAPNAPCGSALPPGVSCDKGAGWCQPGFFCGWQDTTAEASRCLPLPEKCGQEGHACCPSNADTPHTSMDDKLYRKPYCKGGATCFFFAPIAGLNNGDMFAGNKGAYQCQKVPADCGGEGKPCCPMLYKTQANPPLPRQGCPGGPTLFCNYDTSDKAMAAMAGEGPGGVRPMQTPGVCTANTPDCGRFGKACCVTTSGAATGLQCGARYDESGPKGYCADPADLAAAAAAAAAGGGSGGVTRASQRASYKELVCTVCPDKRTADVAANPSKYWPC